MKKNNELLARVRDYILQEPSAYAQGIYAMRSDDSPCGTAACIGGWAAHLSGALSLPELRGATDIYSIARDALGFTDDEANVVFHATALLWPDEFYARYRVAADDVSSARVAADYLDYIISTGRVTD